MRTQSERRAERGRGRPPSPAGRHVGVPKRVPKKGRGACSAANRRVLPCTTRLAMIAFLPSVRRTPNLQARRCSGKAVRAVARPAKQASKPHTTHTTHPSRGASSHTPSPTKRAQPPRGAALHRELEARSATQDKEHTHTPTSVKTHPVPGRAQRFPACPQLTPFSCTHAHTIPLPPPPPKKTANPTPSNGRLAPYVAIVAAVAAAINHMRDSSLRVAPSRPGASVDTTLSASRIPLR